MKGRGLGSAGAREGVEHRWMRKTLQKMPGPRSSLHFSATITHFINTARGGDGNGMGKAREGAAVGRSVRRFKILRLEAKRCFGTSNCLSTFLGIRIEKSFRSGGQINPAEIQRKLKREDKQDTFTIPTNHSIHYASYNSQGARE